ncbi:PspA/IM30 family protein [Lentisphaera profundi]|uniref:PspA/IM30 family protein n=1 Tax=Lentisphaera profundi TaxID=1658616 RepID=A0ABY7W137_9BACT|nr:PspA/IM30 family protein [Lentisphaera profundi]WDE99188.1 PspA/IM30 family protein [Lentisphaera profundi]
MNIFKRISNIMSSKIDDLIAGYEDPEVALDALIQEMEKGIAELRTNAASCISQKKMTEKKLATAEAEVSKWQKNAIAALEKSNEDLARKALERKKNSEEERLALSSQLTEESALVAKIKTQLHQVEDKIQEARQKRDTLVIKKRAADARKKMAETSQALDTGISSSTDSVLNGFADFNKYEEKIERDVAMSEAMMELSKVSVDDLEEQFKELQSDDAISAELEALKAQLKKKK